jgi:hypothetical protein
LYLLEGIEKNPRLGRGVLRKSNQSLARERIYDLEPRTTAGDGTPFRFSHGAESSIQLVTGKK